MAQNLSRRPYDAVDHFHQPPDGYRFSEDSILLADFVRVSGGTAADLGAGCGVAGLCALEKGRAQDLTSLYFVEREPELLACLKKNLALYQRRTRTVLTAVAADWRDLNPADLGGGLDYILANPPYFPLGAGRAGKRPAVEAARREVQGGLAGLIAAAGRLLKPAGRLALMLPLGRRAELLKLLSEHDFKPARLETAGRAAAGPARLLLAEAVKTRS